MPAPAAIAAALQARRAAVRRILAARQLARARRQEEQQNPWRRRVILGALAAAALAVAVPMTMIIVAIGGTRDPRGQLGGVSALALADIPAAALAAYQDAASAWSMDWAILAAVGKAECDHGRSPLSGCNPPDTINSAGARGYMQFLGSTWRRGLGQHELESRSSPPAREGQGYATDGDGDGDADPWSWPDATHSAARYLVSLGVRDNPTDALFGYNRSRTYVAEVMAVADTYRATGTAAAADGSYEGTPGNVPLVTVEGIQVHRDIASQVGGLVQAARAAGFTLSGSGYRSPADQVRLRRQNCGPSDYAVYEMPSSQCSPPTARPGSSNHERGLAVDFSCNGALIRSRSGACFAWMSANAPAHGLHNLPSEPWHWSVDGT